MVYDTRRPYVQTVAPAPNASGVGIGSWIGITFSERMSAATMTSGYIGIYADPLELLEDTTYTYNDGRNTLVLDPSGNLDTNTRYSVVVSGTVQDYAGNSMGMDIWWNFWTGQPSGYTATLVPQNQPAGYVLDGYLEVIRTTPETYSTNLAVGGISPILIELNDQCAIWNRNYLGDASDANPAQFGEAFMEVPATSISRYVTITNNEVMGDPNVGHAAPDYTVGVSGTILRIDGTGWLSNNEYIVTLAEGLPGLRTYPLQEDYSMVFTSSYTPLYIGYNVIRLNIGPMLQMTLTYVPDDTLNRFIYESSRHADNIHPTTIDSSNIPWYVTEFVTYQTKLNALYAAIMLFAATGAGISKSLGDLSIEIDARGLMPALLPIIEDYRKLRDHYMGMVESGADTGPDPVWVVRSKTDMRRPITDTSWRRLPMRDVRSLGASDVPMETRIKWWYTRTLTREQYLTSERYLVDGRYVVA